MQTVDISNDLDAYAKPPKAIKDVYKSFQKLDRTSSNRHSHLPDLSNCERERVDHFKRSNIALLPMEIRQTFREFLRANGNPTVGLELDLDLEATIFQVISVPGKP